MHRGKKKVASQGPSSAAFGKGKGADVLKKSTETPARLRFQNKKPLCLQYNLPSGTLYNKPQFHRTRRPSPSLYQHFIRKILVFCKWMLETTQSQIIDFLLRPATCGVPAVGYRSATTMAQYGESPQTKSTHTSLYSWTTTKNIQKNSLQQRSSMFSRMSTSAKRDYGRAARLARQMDRFSELCVF